MGSSRNFDHCGSDHPCQFKKGQKISDFNEGKKYHLTGLQADSVEKWLCNVIKVKSPPFQTS